MIAALTIATALLGLYMAWSIGANDVANSMADAVGSRSCTIRRAIIGAGLCEFLGAVLVGAHVTDTVRKGIVDPVAMSKQPGLSASEGAALLAIGMMAALLAAALWLHMATWMGLPVSTTHAIVGAVAGFGVVAAGWGAVHWGKIGQIVASWFVSPIVGGLLGFVLFRIVSRLILGNDRPARAATRYAPVLICFTFFIMTVAIVFKGLQHIIAEERIEWLTEPMALLIALGVALGAGTVSRVHLRRKLACYFRATLADQLERVEHVFGPLVFLTSCTVAFAHGANDVANAVGPLAAVADIFHSGEIQRQVAVPLWVLALGGTGIVIGLATYGYRVMTTVGMKITTITPSRGVAADIAAMTTVLMCSRLKLPVSTTHTLVGAILGVALARGLGAVNRRVTRNIFGSWLITVPAAAVLAVVFFLLGRAFLMDYVAGLLPMAAE